MNKTHASDLLTVIKQRLGDKIEQHSVCCDQLTLEISAADIYSVCHILCNDPSLAFTQLSDLCGVDYATYRESDWQTEQSTYTGFSRGRSATDNIADEHAATPKLAVVYHLLSIEHNRRLRLRAFVQGEPPRIASVVDVWAVADWYEREAFDLFGILFDGHPDLRRILTDYGFVGHPLRKDFPLEGHVETRYDPDLNRVVYQPVTIKNRTLVPRVIRDDNRYVKADDIQDEVKKDA